MYTGCWEGNVRERDHLEDLCTGGRVALIGSSISGKAWIGLIWLRTQTAPYLVLNYTLTDVFKLRKVCKVSLFHLRALITLFHIQKPASAHLYYSHNFISTVLLQHVRICRIT